MYTCLIVEDDKTLANAIGQSLAKGNFNYDIANSMKEALAYLDIRAYDCVILDLVLPDAGGSLLCTAIREKTSVPIIIESGNSDKNSKLSAFHAGADSYLTKPLDYDILLAVIKANIRRYYQKSVLNQIESRHFVIDKNLRKVYVKDQEEWDADRSKQINLSDTEYRLLTIFVENNGQLLLYRDIYRMVWKTNCTDDMRPLMVHVSNLKKKIDIFGTNIITTIRGAGYVFSDEMEPLEGEKA